MKFLRIPFFVAPVLFVSCCLPPALAADFSYSGKVLLPDGKPAEGAEVALIRYNSQPEADGEYYVTAAQSTADKNGTWQLRGALPEPAKDKTAGTTKTKTSPGILVAYSPRFGLTWETVLSGAKSPFTLKLSSPGTRRLIIKNREGKSIVGAKIELSWLYRQSLMRGEENRSLSLSKDLTSRWAPITDANGAATLALVPPLTQANFIIAAPGYARLGRSDYDLTDSSKLEIVLPPAITVKGRLVVEADSPLSPAGRKLAFYGRGASDREFYEPQPQTTDEKGEFTLENIGPGKVTVYLRESNKAVPEKGFLPGIEKQFTIGEKEAAQTIEIALKALRAVRVQGKVTGTDGKPLKGVTFYGDGPGHSSGGQLATSDAGGKYEIWAAEGNTRVYPSGAPEGYALPANNYSYNVMRSVKIESGAKGPIAGPDFVLPKAASLLVKVLDAKGQPQAGAIVSFSSSEDQFWPATQRTEANGTVKLTSLTPGHSYIIAARTPGTFSERKTVKAPSKTPLVLRLNPNGGTRLKGRVLSQDGKPIAGAKVQIIANRGRSSGSDTNLVTDKNGNFLSEALWPDAKFSMFVTAANHIPAKSGAWQGEAGQTHDFGTLKLQHLGGVIQGQVRDKNGQPLSGARVWVRAALSQGSGNKTEALSDSRGRFRIEGLPEAPFFIFTQKEGEPLGAAWHSSPKGQRDFIVTAGEYHGSVRPSRSQTEQDAAARRVTLRYLDKSLKHLKAQKGDTATYQMSSLLGWLARLDAPRAIQLAAPQGDMRDRLSMTLGALALKKSPPDITTALARWNSTKEPTYRAYSLADALKDNAKTRPDLARQLVPAALTAARAVPEVSYRVIMLAKIGDALNLLQAGSGDALLGEATATVKQLGASEYEGYARAEVAECIVDKQPDAALALLEPVKDANEKARYYGEIAYRLAKRDPERAIKLIKDNLDEGNQGPRLAGLCHAMATKDLPKAEELTATLKGQNKLNALRWMAEALAPTKPEESLRLWRAALDNAGTNDDDQPYEREQASSEVMLLLARGRDWGAGDVKQRALQALANRPQREANYWEMDDYNLRQEAQYALLLSLADQDLARDYAQSLFPLFAKKKGKIESYMMEPMVLLTLVTDPSLTDQILRNAPAANLPSYTAVALQWVLGTPEERQKQVRSSVWMAEPFEDD